VTTPQLLQQACEPGDAPSACYWETEKQQTTQDAMLQAKT
jgi:hypothetical protein